MDLHSQLLSVIKVNHMLTDQNQTLSHNMSEHVKGKGISDVPFHHLNFLQADAICCSQEIAKDRMKSQTPLEGMKKPKTFL